MNEIKNEGLKNICECLKTNKMLKQLWMSATQITKVDSLAECLKQFPNLEYLSLDSNEIGYTECQNIANALIGCKKLRTLTLNNSISSQKQQMLRSQLKEQHLNLFINI